MIDCDHVFEILTRGPFPSGHSTDGAVSAHLKQCPSCRRLADALRPAVELFRESVSPEESRDLPFYWGPNFGDEPSVAPQAKVAVRTARPAPRAALSQPAAAQQALPLHAVRRDSLRFVGAVMVGAALVIMMNLVFQSDWEPSLLPVLPQVADNAAHARLDLSDVVDLSREEELSMLALNLPRACLAPLIASVVEDSGRQSSSHTGTLLLAKASHSFERQGANCCKSCHHPGTQPPDTLTLAAAHTCLNCHR